MVQLQAERCDRAHHSLQKRNSIFLVFTASATVLSSSESREAMVGRLNV